MNSYSISADSRRWWWPSAAVGAAGTAAITAILVVPGAVQAQPEPIAPAEPAPVFIGETHVHQCFMKRFSWNQALDGPPPTCSSVPGRLRPGACSDPGWTTCREPS